jgi:hypothetical protein
MSERAESIATALQRWASDKVPSSIQFRSIPISASQSRNDYEVLYEFSFSPLSLEKASLDVWITTEGGVAIGIERWKRISERARLLSNVDHRFAGGFEPRKLEVEQLVRICDAVSDGKVEVKAYSIFKRLVSCDVRLAANSDLSLVSRATAFVRALSKTSAIQVSQLDYVSWDAP